MNIKCCGNFFYSVSLLDTMKLDFTVNGFIFINLNHKRGKKPDETGECFT